LVVSAQLGTWLVVLGLVYQRSVSHYNGSIIMKSIKQHLHIVTDGGVNCELNESTQIENGLYDCTIEFKYIGLSSLDIYVHMFDIFVMQKFFSSDDRQKFVVDFRSFVSMQKNYRIRLVSNDASDIEIYSITFERRITE